MRGKEPVTVMNVTGRNWSAKRAQSKGDTYGQGDRDTDHLADETENVSTNGQIDKE